ncbi:5-formyltetrahydrofolate cyclo-ligase [Pseudohalioglobus lutimaris]|uniref:5-formyltetrahydrofolate cyclo-ligase n=1 Tax=Pseudohalioglobus lutimaris TaxID=1737061 RepID=A0A2N5X555_9GAMM|nr:5-formyltetrahydrofolate cyclo-ligase [Pseudohalioglobus lutimaris]PLW69617.1 5-formyltetrahydrofolate cyclo-ligase [Pseudohalioglobus lutimaris]
MSDDSEKFQGTGRFSSPPCLAAEIAPDYFDPLAVDPEQARDVARWRKAERVRLGKARASMSVEERSAATGMLTECVRTALYDRCCDVRGVVLSFYWPIRGEPDLRPLMRELHGAGMNIVLPVVETRAAPLVFRLWTPETRMLRDQWQIPVPPPDAPGLVPEIVLAPLVGWTDNGYRLGNGGGYFDRTLAALTPRPLLIGIGFESARLPTIYPQPHDIPLDLILTEAGERCNHTNE